MTKDLTKSLSASNALAVLETFLMAQELFNAKHQKSSFSDQEGFLRIYQTFLRIYEI